ncbi:substrate-binding domain-containing protein [Methylobacterium pseudosasicola]|uniref:Monosaccharide ABC transporter substrate-binding protein, CUT2 family n=1 Tax=Methylobacterium pseudosasicola TaxID=582667 RepID=A0A1I4JE27_9HYPH|nr:substrate-binding domain-containing protein [Methylobacterium pseudosasicola]SFL64800.1 monosaccharide ABC transporter substrate-binding protein, CUT2 family [Methylobacterium pseudosasicola]
MIRTLRGWAIVRKPEAARKTRRSRIGCVRASIVATIRRLAACAVVLAGLATPALATTIGVAMVQPTGFTQLLRDGIESYAKSVPGVSVQFTYAPEGAGATQVEQVRQFIAAKVDALLILPVDPQANATITRLAQETDIPLVYANNGPREDWFAGRIAFVLPNDLVAGRLQMRKLAQMLDGKGRIAIIAGHPSHSATALRTRGVKEVAASFPGLSVVAEGAADWDRKKAAALVAGWLATGIALDAIVANNDEMAIGASDAVEAAGLPSDRILIGGVDATPDGLKAMQRKRMAVTVYQDAGLQARRAIDDALKLIRRETVQQYDWVPFELVTDRMSTTHFSK